ncbi:assimilatory sulfite reductase (NADPH) hemoprotein subunit [Pleionea mediterranea]|uniref:Sulfite reductase [NADPH] hemoprotein beta-component n=1 Tax=Pleionea mediterranea TaxID=523701 RepID=A0A316FPE7_9GAMM|nr:assimilatory sulfite reductase (NADPH) hemoprotein subunit [Pleionea mediterranea]PWK49992.1 sulfite reductase (NADPH) beta subunit [Pleionea mediterranea]
MSRTNNHSSDSVNTVNEKSVVGEKSAVDDKTVVTEKAVSNESSLPKGLAKNEYIKDQSQYLRGTIKQSLANFVTGEVAENDQQLIKFHGIYQQDDRDLRNERKKQKLEPLYSFMLRARVPAGIATPQQWLTMDRIASDYGNDTIRLTTRQAFQLHGIIKKNLRPTMQAMDKVLLDSIAACGDVNRNVMCNPNPVESKAHKEVYQWAARISEHLLPKTKAYHEIWLNGEKYQADASPENTKEPIYGKHYLPRKFKTVVAIPPYNDVDVFAHDLGFIAIIKQGKLLGFNVTVGGGMGMSHGDPETHPRVADVVGFCFPQQVLAVAEQVVKIQRDFGNREQRKLARFKYTIAKHGVEWFKQQLNDRLGWRLLNAQPFEFTSNSDRYGWIKGFDGRWNLNLYIENGRIKDEGDYRLRTGLREIAKIHQGDFRLTANQNLIIAAIDESNKAVIEDLITQHNIKTGDEVSILRRHAMACVSLPTCSLGMAEAERYMPSLLDKVEQLLSDHGLSEQPITMRMTGCPNGCARPYIAEIGLVGKGPGKYNLFLGAGHHGERLGVIYRDNIGESEILSILDELFEQYKNNALERESFGDFVVRTGVVTPSYQAQDFHMELQAQKAS